MAVAILNGFVQVNVIRDNGAVSQGKNANNAWGIFTKTNYSLSQTGGNLNLLTVVSNIIFDPDVIDNAMTNAGGNSPVAGPITELI